MFGNILRGQLLSQLCFLAITTLITSHSFANENVNVNLSRIETISSSHSVSQLVTQSLMANVVVKHYEGTDLKIKITGDKEIIDKLKIKGEDGIVSIEQPDNFIISDTRDYPEIELQIPRSVPMKIGITSGKWQLGDVDSDVDILVVGSADIDIGTVKGQFNVSVSGNAQINVEKVIGSADIELNGSGNVNIKSGEIPLLITSVQGSGNIVVNGEVKDGEFSVIGSGGVSVSKLKGNVSRQEIIGVSKISYM
jgi:hypothetical protein